MTTAVRLNLKVAPKSSRNAITGWMGDTLKLSVTTAPEKGKANQMVIDVLAEALNVSRSSISIVRGETATTKLVEITHLTDAEIFRRLNKPVT
ncbi:MAG: DUF167 domain-containing protein [Pseudomonadota bacterium]